MRRLFILVPIAFASTAQADTTASYAGPGSVCSMNIEISSNGDLRGEMKGSAPGMVPGRAYYFVGGHDYFVDPGDNGGVVMRLEDMAKVLAEQADKTGFSSFQAPTLTLVRRGTVSINKWSGDAYYMQAPNGQVSPRPVAVISHDPSLAELGKAMARQFATSETMMSQLMNGHALMSNMDQVLGSGAPISFAGAELQSVTFEPIAKEQFKLPSLPVRIDEVRKRMTGAAKGVSVTLPEGQKPAVPCHIMIGG
jgi:hypothetical protein